MKHVNVKILRICTLGAWVFLGLHVEVFFGGFKKTCLPAEARLGRRRVEPQHKRRLRPRRLWRLGH
jgi:hypothetical protein